MGLAIFAAFVGVLPVLAVHVIRDMIRARKPFHDLVADFHAVPGAWSQVAAGLSGGDLKTIWHNMDVTRVAARRLLRVADRCSDPQDAEEIRGTYRNWLLNRWKLYLSLPLAVTGLFLARIVTSPTVDLTEPTARLHGEDVLFLRDMTEVIEPGYIDRFDARFL